MRKHAGKIMSRNGEKEMKVNALDLLVRLNKVNGVVSDKSVIEEFKSFHFLPDVETGIVKIAGTDGNMTLLQTLEFEPTEASDGSLLVLSVGKILDIIRYAGHEVEFVYSEEDNKEDGIKIVTPKSEITLLRHFGLDDDLVNFDLDQETDFVDEFTAGELKALLSSLSGVVDASETDESAKTVFLTKENAVVGDDMTFSRISKESNEAYELTVRAVRQMLSLLGSLDADSTVYLKKTEDGEKTIFKTDLEVMSFMTPYVAAPDMTELDEFASSFSVVVDKNELVRSIHLVRSTSTENTINFEMTENILNLTSFFLGEQASDELDVFQHLSPANLTSLKFHTSALDLLKLLAIITSDKVVLALDKDLGILQVRDPQNVVMSAITVTLV